ncbi:MAG: A/G-specific adenine glycosylase [Planctomycetota bacterium]|nr:A/G-specific adenine glycosylase [Planctomycetota bacterium]
MSTHDDLRHLARSLEDWFSREARDLPWRSSRSGYHALVSEAMLQQTQVSRVVDSFNRFIDRFPTVESLSQADEQDVLALWQGLGYYRRARHLHAAARMIRDEFGGVIPEDADALLRLPGVGRYTAGAIASIVFGKRAPIVDGNVSRVLARVNRQSGRSGEPAFDAWCWARADEMVHCAHDPGVLNEAMMELGATVCTKHGACCGTCPLSADCQAAAVGDVEDFPTPKLPPARRQVHHHALMLLRSVNGEQEVLLQQRPDRGLWSRMWQPPTLEYDQPQTLDELAEEWGIDPKRLTRSHEFDHRTSHRDVRFHVHHAVLDDRTAPPGTWHPVRELDEIPMANPHRRIVLAQPPN